MVQDVHSLMIYGDYMLIFDAWDIDMHIIDFEIVMIFLFYMIDCIVNIVTY